jgi:molecular chaperone GrpE
MVMEIESLVDADEFGSSDRPSVEARGLQEKISEVEARIEKLQAALHDAQAETRYVHHRTQEDIEHAYKFAIESFARALLPFKDNLEMSLNIKTDDVDALKKGIELTLKQLDSTFRSNSVDEINPSIGETFDPARHRLAKDLPDRADGAFVTEVREKGYAIGERVLRLALVSVSAENAD